MFLLFLGNRRTICGRSPVSQTTMGLHQLDSIQHHRWNVGWRNINCSSRTCTQHNPLTSHWRLSIHHLNYRWKHAITRPAAKENHQSAYSIVHPVSRLIPTQLRVVFVDAVLVEAWFEASTGGGRCDKAIIARNTHCWEFRKTSLKLFSSVLKCMTREIVTAPEWFKDPLFSLWWKLVYRVTQRKRQRCHHERIWRGFPNMWMDRRLLASLALTTFTSARKSFFFFSFSLSALALSSAFNIVVRLFARLRFACSCVYIAPVNQTFQETSWKPQVSFKLASLASPSNSDWTVDLHVKIRFTQNGSPLRV